MREIETANIKINTLPTASAKREAPQVSKKDFMEKFESFLEKNKKADTKDSEVKETSVDDSEEEVSETQEDFDSVILLNLVDLNQLDNQPVEIKTGFSVANEVTEVVELPEVEIDVSHLVNLLETTNDAVTIEELTEMIETVDQTQIEELVRQIEIQLSENPELELKAVVEGLLSENMSKIEEDTEIFNLEGIEKISQDDGSFLKEVAVEVPEIIEQNSDSSKPTIQNNIQVDVETVLDEAIEETVTVEEVETVIKTEANEIDHEVIIEEQPVDLSNSSKTFELVNRTTFVQEVSAPVQQVSQDEFISNVESLIIEQTEVTDTTDHVTTARMQLTPDHLGKVSLQIEMNGKELTAKLIVEQHETKEWIDQQVAHLKEKLLAQEITVTEFQVVVDENPSNNRFMSNEENPFFKQKEKDSQQKRKQRMTKAESIDTPARSAQVQYADAKGISLFV